MIKTIKLTDGKRVPLRQHQAEAILNAQSHFEKGYDRATIVHCCRSGKSLTSVGLHKQLKNKASVIFLPSINLIQQTIGDWQVNLPKARVLIISCDKTIKGGEVTTRPKKIREFINRSIGSEFIIFCTYQSSKKLCKAMSKINNFSFDLMVADEAHRSAGVNLKQSRYIHFNSCISSRRRLYMTATPKFVSRRLRSFLHRDAKVSCMTNKDIFGKQVHLFSFKEGIDRGILSDYEIVALGCKDDSKIDAIHDATNDDHLHIKETAKLHALHKALSDRDVSHCVSFHSNKSKAKFFEKNFNLEGWEVFHINGDHTAEERAKTLEAFRKADKALLTNCRCLNEGVNLVECDSVFFSDVKNGAVDVVQSASRPLTKDPSKPKSFKNAIFIPTFHSELDSVERICSTTSYKILIQLIRHMRGQDERIEAFLTALRLNRQGERSQEVDDIIKVEGFGGLTEDIFNSIIPHDIVEYSDRELWEAFKASFELGDKNRGGMKTASENLGMSASYIRIRANKSPWLRKKIAGFRKDQAITNTAIYDAVVEARGSLTNAGIKLGRSSGFVGMRIKAQPKLARKLEKWFEDHPQYIDGSKYKPAHGFDDIIEAYRKAGYHKNRAGVLLGQTTDYISGVEARKPELKEILYQVALEDVKPADMSEKDFRHALRYGGCEAFVQKREWEKKVTALIEKDPERSCPKIASEVGCSPTFVYKLKKNLLKK